MAPAAWVWCVWLSATALGGLGASGCGARDGLDGDSQRPGRTSAPAQPELCDGLDNDLDLAVDEDFRDADGLFVDDAHCGQCGRACDRSPERSTEVGCRVTAAGPACAALACESGYAVTRAGSCEPIGRHLCLACAGDGDCGPFPSARCAPVFGVHRCVVGCDGACPDAYVCGVDDQDEPACVPMGGSCLCQRGGVDFQLACQVDDGSRCPGLRSCRDGVLSACAAPPEMCDGQDNDCDGAVDEDFLDVQGAYSRVAAHCGRCGRDCNQGAPGLDLLCGGDPFAPTCVLDCGSLADGKQVGDAVDADGDLANGCECVVRSLVDAPEVGPGPVLDDNCDGTDGEVISTIYVATDGDDTAAGSPSRPLRSISEAISRAQAGRNTVMMAAGTYVETIVLRPGLTLLGGYRRDFLMRDFKRFQVRVSAPPDSELPMGAVAIASDLAGDKTVLQGLVLQGRDVDGPGEPAAAMVIVGGEPNLVLEDVELYSGRPGAASQGDPGAEGIAPASGAVAGEPPRAAVEDGQQQCLASAVENTVRGGRGGRNSCRGIAVHGGDGGGSACPTEVGTGGTGGDGRSAGIAAGGRGGRGGSSVAGPISGGLSCPTGVCCGLADFVVAPDYEQARAGGAGTVGVPGESGAGCADPMGSFVDGLVHVAPLGESGGPGFPGSGGGGGGGGGGALFEYTPPVCTFADGLGGGGGGGGAGGCGGAGGLPGQSGGPAIGLLVANTSRLPTLTEVVFAPADGAAGGPGGSGGAGAAGGIGGLGGSLDRELRVTPTLAGPGPGEQGGPGGAGGTGGGGGGGCGGSSVGLWLVGVSADAAQLLRVERDNIFKLGSGGAGGPGGGGVSVGNRGEPGRVEALWR